MPDLAALTDPTTQQTPLLDTDLLPIIRKATGFPTLLIDTELSELEGYLAGKPITYAQLPGEVQNLPVPYYHSGPMFQDEQCLMFVVNQPLFLPANMAGIEFLTFDFPASDQVFEPAIYHAGVWTPLGALTVGSTGSMTPPECPATALGIGDAFRLVGPHLPDAGLKNFSFCFMFTRV